jgi:PhzF family phenazine biosynthesis protein
MNQYKIYQVDAFADRPFKGNPAGVMIVKPSTSGQWMQKIAMEMNLSETAFLWPVANGFKIRYFTPLEEVPLCGHATLAAAHILYELGLANRKEPILLKAAASDLIVRAEGKNIIMDFPRYTLNNIKVPENFASMLGFEPVEFYRSDYGWLIAVAKDENAIKNSDPDFEKIKKNGLGQLMITAKSDVSGVDFVVRCFVPSVGINEDPVTGSAHCALTPLWAKKLGKLKMRSFQASGRTGNLEVTLNGDRVLITGKAITIFEADLKIKDSA